MPAVAFENVVRVRTVDGINPEPHFPSAPIDDVALPVEPVHVGSHGPRRINLFPVRIVPHPGFVQAIEYAVAMLQPFMKLVNALVTVTVEPLLRLRPDIASP